MNLILKQKLMAMRETQSVGNVSIAYLEFIIKIFFPLGIYIYITFTKKGGISKMILI